MLLEPEACHCIDKILSVAQKMGVTPFRLNGTTKQMVMSKKVGIFKFLWGLNFFLGIFALLKFAIAVYLITILYTTGQVGMSYWIFWIIMFLITPVRLWLSLVYLLQKKEFQYNLNFGFQLMELLRGKKTKI